MPERLQCWLLCEDIEQERLFRAILRRHFRRVYVEPRRPQGGASFVLRSLPDLAKHIRRRRQEAVGLLVVIDGDTVGFRHRLQEIAAAAGLTGANWEERIGRCVPCRSVETWEMWLCGERELDEQSSYKHAFRRQVEQRAMSARQAAEAWLDAPPDQQAEESRLPALAHGRKEVARLRDLAKP